MTLWRFLDIFDTVSLDPDIKSSPLVTTIEYREESLRIYQSIFLQHPDPKGKYRKVDKSQTEPKK